MEKNENGWWVIRNSKVDFNYNGIAPNEYGFWYCAGGKVDFTYNGYAALYSGGPSYKVSGGQADISSLTNTTRLIHVSGSGYDHWFYAPGGKVNYTYNGTSENQYGIWQVSDGCVDFDAVGYYRYVKTASADVANKVYYINKGKLDTSWTKVSGWLTSTDLSLYSSKIDGYVNMKNGYQDLTTAAVLQDNYFYYMIQGACNPYDDDQRGYILRTVNIQKRLFYSGRSKGGTDGPYRGVECANGEIICVKNNIFQSTFTGGVGQYYFKNGVLAETFTGLAKDVSSSLEKYRFYNNGIFKSDYTGLCKATIDGVSGEWYVQNGYLAKKTTVFLNSSDGIYYYIQNGNADTGFTGFIYTSIDDRIGYYYFEDNQWDSERCDIISDSDTMTTPLVNLVSDEALSMPSGLDDSGSYLVENGKLADVQSLDAYYYNQLDSEQRSVYRQIEAVYERDAERAVRRSGSYVTLQGDVLDSFIYRANAMRYIGTDEGIENVEDDPFVSFASPIPGMQNLDLDSRRDTMIAYIYDHPDASRLNQRNWRRETELFLAGTANGIPDDQGIDESVLTELSAEIAELHQNNGSETDEQKALDIYDYIGEYGEYDYESLERDDAEMVEVAQSGGTGLYICGLQDNAYEFADDHKAVCSGFAQAFTWLCRQDGIECIAVLGIHVEGESAGLHAWNLVYLDGEWYMVDPTAAVGDDGKIKWTRFNYSKLVDNHAGDSYNFNYPGNLAN